MVLFCYYLLGATLQRRAGYTLGFACISSFARWANLPEGLYILPMFFLYFLFF